MFESVEKACDLLIEEDKSNILIKENAEKYEQLYEIYKKLYLDLKDTFKRLDEISG
jgi:xylulokinase